MRDARNHGWSYVLVIIIAAAWLAACGSDTGGGDDGGLDADAGGDGGDSTATFVKPEGYASVTFFVDDTANQTYGSGDIEWKGSFVYDPATNIITHDPAWAGEVGPYPPLYDDGPIAEGGHEMPGASAGDHIFSVEVYVKAEADRDLEFQYGAINEFDNWIWEGPNGEFVLPAGGTSRLDAPGYVIPGFGTYDLIVTLDTSQLNEAFRPFDPQNQKIYLKGSMNSWDARQLLDDGQRGDVAAGDGIYTYHHAENLGPHDGMLFAGQHVQFVFMLDGLEYKRIDALADGVAAMTNCAGPDSWEQVPVIMEPESRGRIKNTAVVVCEGGGKVAVTSLVPASGDPAGGEPVSVYGSGFQEGAVVTFDGLAAGDIQYVSAGQLDCTTPAHQAGVVTVRVTNPNGDFGEKEGAFAYQAADQPEILFVDPRRGSTAGGTAVTITGRNFLSGAAVEFGQQAATGVVVASDTSITCQTPAQGPGTVDVTVTNPGGGSAVFPDGFEYVESSGPLVTGVVPSFGSTEGGEAVTVTGSGFVVGASVTFGGLPAGDIVVDPPGAIHCTTPAHQAGLVDVTVRNPDNQSDTLAGGFTYQVPQVDWAGLQWPLSLVLNAGETSPEIYGQVYEAGLTEPPGCAPGISAELGWGPAGSDPAVDDSAWQWTPASCNGQCSTCGNNDEYQGTISINDPGQYLYTFRFSLDGGDWLVAEGRGSATVRGAGEVLEIWQVEPDFGSVLGGSALTVRGAAFVDGAVVSLDGVPLQTSFVDSGTLQVVAPAHPAGAVEVAVSNPDDSSASLPQGFVYVLRATPDLEPGSSGEIEIDTTSGNDWDELLLVGENAAGSDWGSNHADRLYLAYDDENLYLGIAGFVESGATTNAIVAYLDIDYGPASGVGNMNTLADDSGGLDAAVSSVCVVGDAGFGAEYAAGTLGMAAIEADDNDPQRWNLAGLRGLDPADDFPWLSGATVRTGPVNQVVEMALPWQVLLGGPLPGSGFRAALFVRLLNGDGQYLSNDTLPADDPLNPQEVNQVVVFDVR